MKPQRRDISFTITLPANISPWYQATLYAKVPGYLTSMGFDKGDWVKKGQLLAVIDAPEVEQQYRQAEADHAIKQITYQRLLSVWKENPDVIAKQDVDVAAAAAEAARHLRDNRRTMLNYTKVYAPFSGVITARFADPGALIQSAAVSATQAVPLYTIMDLDTVRVYVSVPQEVALLAKPGVPVVVTTKEMHAKEFKGSITRTTEALDPATRTLLVEIDMPNKERQLQPGTYVSATLYLKQHPNALVIPPAAIVTGANKERAVFTAEQGKARQVAIKTDLDDGKWVEVVAGLSGNEDIIVVGKSGLKDGQAVDPSPYNLPAGTPSSQKY
jgi:RND family efflux transporter MFP subunit